MDLLDAFKDVEGAVPSELQIGIAYIAEIIGFQSKRGSAVCLNMS